MKENLIKLLEEVYDLSHTKRVGHHIYECFQDLIDDLEYDIDVFVKNNS